ncbi:MATE family efflux transporter [Sellimonas catena]|uniref:Multidrug export protein MepA n=1 Tax=Sellimonas catena TaxID=2994035 RepID=A0A9W6C5Y7_9FIRM|nr:MATE family efflux transporter [Sellimonas catena]GLG04729.1 MATE family efflux transporter [Sellimonas catena]GLG90792.1 MATE family efflux transporter [Sellimonas catena]
MTKNTPFQDFIRYSFFSIMGMIAISCYILADTFFVAQGLGTNGLAALNLAIPTYDFIHGTGLMLGMGGATRFSILKSQNNQKGADTIFTNTVYLGIFFSIIFMLGGLFFSGSLARLLGANQNTFEMTNTYLRVMMLFSPAFIFNDIILCFVRNDGNPRLSMIATVCGSLFNVVFDYIFIFPCNMGMLGAVLATGFSPVVGLTIMSPHWLGKKRGFHFRKLVPDADSIRTNISLGFPSLLSQISAAIVMIIFNMLILGLEGNTGVAAYGVIANISLVVLSFYTGIAQGIQPLVSHSYGRKKTDGIRQFLRYAMISMVILSAVMYLILFVFADPIASAFNSEHNAKLQEIAITGLKLYFTSLVFAGFNIILSMYFTSVEKALPAQIISLLRGLILIIPIAFLFANLWDMTGVWMSFPATELVTAVVGAVLYFIYKNRLYSK